MGGSDKVRVGLLNFSLKGGFSTSNCEENESKLLKVSSDCRVSTATQTSSLLTFHVESQRYNNNNIRDETFQNVELKKINRRKHHREKVQERVESTEQETQERGQAREARREEREDRGRDNSAQRNGKNEEDEKWKFDRREFHFTFY